MRIAGNNFANLPTTGVLNKQLFFTVKKFLSNDLQIENLSGSGTAAYRDWETDRKSTRLNSSHRSLSRMPSSA